LDRVDRMDSFLDEVDKVDEGSWIGGVVMTREKE